MSKSLGYPQSSTKLFSKVFAVLILALLGLLSACSTVNEAEMTQETPAELELQASSYPLRGRTSFSASQLSSEERKWYDALWEVIKNPYQHPNATSLAKSGDIYLYRGDLQGYVISVLMAFRLTGDLKLLDEVSRISQLMRGKLRDTNGDGYLNWVNLHDEGTKYYGKDTQEAYEMKAHALVAMMAWAFQNNRDLRSPGGYNYGSQADFWENYLVKHFEAKWRKRNGESSGFPFASSNGFHTSHSWMRWHYYMGKLTGNSAYTREAQRMISTFWGNDHLRTTDSKYGTALVWSNNTRDSWLHPQTYARYVVEEAVDLHFEGFGVYGYDSTLERAANAVAAFVIDDSDFESFARDIGGGRERAGISASPTSYSRMSDNRFAESAWAFLAAWDHRSSERIKKAATTVYGNVEMIKYGRDPKRIYIPVGLFVASRLN